MLWHVSYPRSAWTCIFLESSPCDQTVPKTVCCRCWRRGSSLGVPRWEHFPSLSLVVEWRQHVKISALYKRCRSYDHFGKADKCLSTTRAGRSATRPSRGAAGHRPPAEDGAGSEGADVAQCRSRYCGVCYNVNDDFTFFLNLISLDNFISYYITTFFIYFFSMYYMHHLPSPQCFV